MPTPAVTPTNLPDNFYLTLAVGVRSLEDVLAMYDLTREDAEHLQADPIFQQRLLLAKDAVETDGSAFFARCRLLAGETLPHVTDLIKDPGTPSAVQLDAWKTLAKYGRLEPAPATAAAGHTGPQLTLTIIAPNGGTSFSADLTPLPPALEHNPTPTYSYIEEDDWVDPPDLPTRRISARDLGFA